MQDSETPKSFLPEDVCEAFMTKTMTLNTEFRRSPEEEANPIDTAYFYCLKTMREHGPDEDDVEPETCRPRRSCYCDIDPT